MSSIKHFRDIMVFYIQVDYQCSIFVYSLPYSTKKLLNTRKVSALWYLILSSKVLSEIFQNKLQKYFHHHDHCRHHHHHRRHRHYHRHRHHHFTSFSCVIPSHRGVIAHSYPFISSDELSRECNGSLISSNHAPSNRRPYPVVFFSAIVVVIIII